MKVQITPATLHGTVTAPPSKSYAHRMMICSALSDGTSTVRGISDSEDMKATLDCISALGINYEKTGDTVSIHGGIGDIEDNTVFCCRESGSTLRFMIPIALTTGKTVQFKGTKRLIERGIGIYEDLFSERGTNIQKTADTITMSGVLKSGEYTMRGDVSSQFVSGLLFSLPLLDGNSTVTLLPPIESRKYIDITIDAIRSFGVKIEEKDSNTFYIPGNQSYRHTDITVEGDWSNSAVFYAFNSIGSDITVTGLNNNSLQGDMVCKDLLKRLDCDNPVIDISDCPDLGPVLFAAAALKHGATFNGTRRLRIKESDRAKSMADELAKFGIQTDIFDNSVVIHNNTLTPPNDTLHGHNDHRIVMAMTLLSSVTGGVIDDAESVSKSYPDFFDVLRTLGLEVEDEA